MNIHWKGWNWSWSSNTLASWCKELTHQRRPWCWERLRAGGEGDDRGWDGWMASPTQWTWVWASSRRCERQGSLACCSPWGPKESEMTEQPNNSNNNDNKANTCEKQSRKGNKNCSFQSRIDAFELWCWRRFLRVPWTARRSNQSILKEINPEYSLEGLMLKLNLQYLAIWWEELTHWKRPWCWERLKVGGEGDDRGRYGWMASPTQWTWVWASSRRWWRTGRPGVLQSMGSQRVGPDWATEINLVQNPRLCIYDLITSQRPTS